MTDQCGNCRFYHTDGPLQKICRRNPPSPFPIPGNGFTPPQLGSFYPPVQENGWCGEYRSLAAASATIHSIAGHEPSAS